MRTSYRKAILFAILGGVVALVVFGPARFNAPELSAIGISGPGRDKDAAPGNEKGATPLTLPERAALSEPSGTLFGAQTWQPPAPKIVGPPPRPVAPPMPYRFAGRVVHGGKLQVFLTRGDVAIPISQGETLDGTYRVESIGAERITMVYLPLDERQSIPVTPEAQTTGASAPSDATRGNALRAAIGTIPTATAIKPPAPPTQVQQKSTEVAGAGEKKSESKLARLLWEGPSRVKVGAEFSVALRLISDQPLHDSPMQVKFDPTLLETVAVKPGGFFGKADRNFNYRVNPDGSIFIGASGRGSVPPSDAELLVLTFRPIKAASVAELSLVSLNLQGTAGRTIAFDSLAAFKTAIIP